MHPEYRAFLEQIRAEPYKEHVPSAAVDIMWHEHILDTKAYTEFCNDFFGAYLHHKPGKGYCAATITGA